MRFGSVEEVLKTIAVQDFGLLCPNNCISESLESTGYPQNFRRLNLNLSLVFNYRDKVVIGFNHVDILPLPDWGKAYCLWGTLKLNALLL